MEPITTGLQIAGRAVAPLLQRLLLPAARSPAAEYGKGAKPIKVRRLLSFVREHRTLTEDDLHRLARELVRRAALADGPYDPPVAREQHEAVGHALTRTLHALGDLDINDVQAVALGPQALAEKLAGAAGQQTRQLLGEDAGRFHDRLLVTACVHILRFFSELPGFAARTQIQVSQGVAEVDRKVGRVLEQLGALLRQEADADEEFESGHCEYVARQQNRLTIHGVDLNDPGGQNWPLESAYLTMEAVPSYDAAAVPRPGRSGPDGDTDDGGPDEEESGRAIEAVFADHDRVLLRGVAGTGKTTLVQWLAFITARTNSDAYASRGTNGGGGVYADQSANGNPALDEMPEQPPEAAVPPHLLGRVPFVLPLRNLTGRNPQPPSADDLLSWAGGVQSAPAGWADRVLRSGRALMLVDGVDEVPKGQRDTVRDWLRRMMNAYPGNNLWLVTTRPSVLESGWLVDEDFREFTLNPMRPSDTKRFVERWHVAAGASVEKGEELTRTLRSSAELSRLATNPLMCGLICALNRERNGHLPEDRTALYDAALVMLLQRRDPERKVYTRLNHESAMEPLKRLAYWLIRNERLQLDWNDAVREVRALQPSLPQLDGLGSANDALQFLLERSGLLREPDLRACLPTAGTAAGSSAGTAADGPTDTAPEATPPTTDRAVAFIHRTFQDFLGAKALLDVHDVGNLVKHAHLDEWEDVVQMAVAQGDHTQRAEILTGLTERADNTQDVAVQARLRLLAFASLQLATRLDPAVRDSVSERATAMLPPKSLREARALARTGPLLLRLLPGPGGEHGWDGPGGGHGPDAPDVAGGLSGDEELATVHAMCQIGGDPAVSRLQEFLDTHQPAVRAQLLGHWDRFDTDEYAKEIIEPLLRRTPGGIVTVRSAVELARLRGMPNLQRVGCHGDFAPDDVLAVLDPGTLRELRLRGALQWEDLELLTHFGELETLVLEDCRNLRDPEPLTRLPALKRLTLRNLPLFGSLSALADCPRLTGLFVGSDVPWRGLCDLPRAGSLQSLGLPPATTSLEGIDTFAGLRELHLQDASDRLVPDEWGTQLEGLSELRTLSLSPEQLGTLLSCHGLALKRIERLEVRARPGDRPNLELLPMRLPKLTDLHLSGEAEVDLAQLAGLGKLRHVRLAYPGTVLGREELPEAVGLEVYPSQ